MVEVVNRQRLIPVEKEPLERLVGDALSAIGSIEGSNRAGTVTVALVRDPAIRELNRVYRGKNRPTDVLSFPSGDDGSDPERHIGDIIISADTALRQAEESGLNVEREIAELALHGVLHLCGYDHETDGGKMNRLELRLRKRLLDRTGSSTQRRSGSS